MNNTLPTTDKFRWPAGVKGAVSLSFDDARASQIDQGFPILQKHGVRATFYVVPSAVEKRVSDWQRLHAAGHELGNHTTSHPCSGNFPWSKHNAIEDYSLERMAGELDGASDAIAKVVGSRPTTFAFPCGQTFIGRGAAQRSYVPLIADRFLIGRGFNNETHVNPGYCDPALVSGVNFDGVTIDQVMPLIHEAAANGTWLILAGHDVGPAARQTVVSEVLDAVCAYCKNSENGIWIDTVARIGDYVHQQRRGE